MSLGSFLDAGDGDAGSRNPPPGQLLRSVGGFNGFQPFNGIRGDSADALPLNPDDSPRITGRLQYNVFDTEDAFFYGGNYLGTKHILSFGVGFDHQKDAVFVPLLGGGRLGDYTALSADLFFDWPLSDDLEATGLLTFLNYDYGSGAQPLKVPP